MRRFTIDSAVLGTKRHIVGDVEGYTWSDSVSRDTWHLTGELKSAATSKCLDTLLRLTQRDLPSVPERYVVAMRHLVTGSQVIPWQTVLPQDQFKEFFKNLVQETTDAFSGLPFDYYDIAWSAGSRVLGSLRPACIDTNFFNSAIQENPGSPGLESFRPKRSGYAHPVTYDRFATRTGRLTVIEGPNILILKKDLRRIIKSSFDGGSIVYLDFRALEARIVLAEAGRSSSADDIYQDISNVQFKGILPRDVVKVAVLAELYGISRGALKTKLGVSDQKLDSFISVIKDYFKVEDLRSRLRRQVALDGKMFNRFGRPLRVPESQDNLLVNTYAQSSGVDVSLIGFDNLLARLGSEGIRPLFVLHDAIVLDVRPDRLEDVLNVRHLQIATYDQIFPVKADKIDDI